MAVSAPYFQSRLALGSHVIVLSKWIGLNNIVAGKAPESQYILGKSTGVMRFEYFDEYISQ
jgi:hypothetical protein